MMRARARLVVEAVGPRSVIRVLESAAPLTLLPRRGTRGAAVVHLVNSAAAPLGGDHLTLSVEVAPGAALRLVGVAATVALPGTGRSATHLRLTIGDGASFEHLPEPTVVTRHADHHATLTAELTGTARLRLRETLVLGRKSEAPGHLTTETHITHDARPLLRQSLTTGDPATDQSLAGLAGHKVLTTEISVGTPPPPAPVSGDWWSLVPLGPATAPRGYLATALGPDAVTASARLGAALAAATG
ncbi:Urease accessory protein UreD [Actinokineospora spheciospongiae]|uniref:Urease accessory protein UreD n=2 Tax=Actinokineospora spheciospongiae TaxID=909613 RepID=W7IJ37_9PSEU|nr:Urease accessory protein UreD [Actinokineospora spheciospongiae]